MRWDRWRRVSWSNPLLALPFPECPIVWRPTNEKAVRLVLVGLSYPPGSQPARGTTGAVRELTGACRSATRLTQVAIFHFVSSRRLPCLLGCTPSALWPATFSVALSFKGWQMRRRCRW